MKVIGIDPGINKIGYSVIEDFKILECGILKVSPKLNFEEKIEYFLKNFKKILEKYLPDIVAIEEVYVSKNVKTALNMGILVGGIISISLSHNIKFFLIPPTEIKKAITGKGSATKEQVKFMVENLTNFYGFKNFEETDATASAIASIFKLKENVLLHKR